MIEVVSPKVYDLIECVDTNQYNGWYAPGDVFIVLGSDGWGQYKIQRLGGETYNALSGVYGEWKNLGPVRPLSDEDLI